MMYAHLRINDHAIGLVTARRIVTGESGVNEYDWTVSTEDERGRHVEERGQALKHHYQDGALVLLSKVLEAAGFGP